MHSHMLESWQHDHVFLGAGHQRNERRTWLVAGLTALTMIAEIVGGSLFGSMALLADGWHMSTHTLAIGIAALAYWFARRHAHDARFTFGTGKLGELAAFSSALVLALVAVGIAYESARRLASPAPIAFSEAIPIAAIGLVVNLVSVFLLRDEHHHHHDHADDHDHDHDDHDHHDDAGHAHDHHHHDHNLRAAYIHVLADTATSVLAICGLMLARSFGWLWIDPAIGLIGACVIASWAYGLIRDSGAVLLDIVPDRTTGDAIRSRLEIDGDRVTDLHLWQVGPGHRAAVLAIVSDAPQQPSAYKERLAGLRGLSHVTVEVHRCPGHHDKAA
jgi:cation diffusion facilitator family transporter